MKVIRLLFFIPPILCTAQAGAQEIISNMPTINSESTETVLQREPTQAEKEAAEATTIKYGRNGEREIPNYMALRSFANSALQAFANPARRESWYAAYDLDEGKEEK